jgi:hypothetical protein
VQSNRMISHFAYVLGDLMPRFPQWSPEDHDEAARLEGDGIQFREVAVRAPESPSGLVEEFLQFMQ